jgi:septum formation protein
MLLFIKLLLNLGMEKIILASNSPRRKELLTQIGLKFKIIPSNYEEDMDLKLSHKELAKTLAYNKAKDVADKVNEGIIIGSDTFIVVGDKRIGKPKDANDAKRILKNISGRTITNYSGLSIIDKKNKKVVKDVEVTWVKIKKLSEREIDEYIKTGEPLDKAGAFAIQGRGAIFIEKIDGCYSNVIGLPLYKLYINLLKIGVDILKD